MSCRFGLPADLAIGQSPILAANSYSVASRKHFLCVAAGAYHEG
jgi:hypothetical protein